jgi:hypothetical protein
MLVSRSGSSAGLASKLNLLEKFLCRPQTVPLRERASWTPCIGCGRTGFCLPYTLAVPTTVMVTMTTQHATVCDTHTRTVSALFTCAGLTLWFASRRTPSFCLSSLKPLSFLFKGPDAGTVYRTWVFTAKPHCSTPMACGTYAEGFYYICVFTISMFLVYPCF